MRPTMIALLPLLVFACDKSEPVVTPSPAQPATNTAAPAAAPTTPSKSAPPKEKTFSVGELALDAIPKSVATKGSPVQAARFTDHSGDNVVVLSVDEKTKALQAIHVLLSANTAKVLREVKQTHDCEFDYAAAFVPSSLGVTDLNDDDLGEVTFAYKYACGDDIGPSQYKLLVLEAGEKSILRGEEILLIPGEAEPIGSGKFEAEGFDDSPKLLEHAKTVWKRNVLTRM